MENSLNWYNLVEVTTWKASTNYLVYYNLHGNCFSTPYDSVIVIHVYYFFGGHCVLGGMWRIDFCSNVLVLEYNWIQWVKGENFRTQYSWLKSWNSLHYSSVVIIILVFYQLSSVFVSIFILKLSFVVGQLSCQSHGPLLASSLILIYFFFFPITLWSLVAHPPLTRPPLPTSWFL